MGFGYSINPAILQKKKKKMYIYLHANYDNKPH